MGIHTGSVEKVSGSNPALGAPVQWEVHGIQAVSVDGILAVQTVGVDDGPTDFSDAEGDFTAQPLHPRPVRVDWSATAGTVSAVVVKLYGRNFWRDSVDPKVIRLTAIGNEDTEVSYRDLGFATVEVIGTAGSTADVSIGLGDGIGTPVPILDNSLVINDPADIDNNKDIVSLKNPASDVELTAPTTVNPAPNNTLIFAALPSDIKFEMQTRYGNDHIG